MCPQWVIPLKTPRILVESSASAARTVSLRTTKVRNRFDYPRFRLLDMHQDEKNTKEAVDEEGWVHTGDVAEIDHCGRVKIVDRVKVRRFLHCNSSEIHACF